MVLILNVICVRQGKTTVLLTASDNFNVGVHLDAHESISFKLFNRINTSKMYILIQVVGIRESKIF